MQKSLSRTARREWLSFFSLTAWYFSVYQSFDPTIYARGMNLFWFSLALALPMIALSMIFSKDVAPVARLARYSAPVGIALTLVMPHLPAPGFTAAFIASAPFIAPLALRCCFGTVTSAREDRRLQTFMSAITASIFAHALWLLAVRALLLPPAVQFLFPAAMGLTSYICTRHEPPACNPVPGRRSITPSRHLVPVLIVFIIVFVFDLSSDLFHAYFLDEGLSNNTLLLVGGIFLPAASLTLYAALADRKLEKMAILAGLSLYLLGLVLALFQGDAGAAGILVFADGIGGAYADFFVVGFSIMFFAEAGRPVLMSSLGLSVDILTASFLWTVEKWLPQSFLQSEVSAEHVLVMAVLTLLLLVMALVAFDRRNEKTFVLSLLNLLSAERDSKDESNIPLPAAAMESSTARAAELSDVERTVATLFIEGCTQHDIARRLHISAAEVAAHQRNIKGKISSAARSAEEENRLIDTAASRYGIRPRQLQILRSVFQGLTNAQIAEIHHITQRTVKYHISELLSKTGAKNRRELIEKLSAEAQAESEKERPNVNFSVF